jgi:hypothetical protein
MPRKPYFSRFTALALHELFVTAHNTRRKPSFLRINCLRGCLHSRFCVRFSVRDGATAQLLPLLFSRNHARDRAKEVVGRRRHRGRRNERKKRECRRPLKGRIHEYESVYDSAYDFMHKFHASQIGIKYFI